MRVGQKDSQGRVYFRCQECGDSSKNKWKCHAFVDTKGATHCNRCGYSSRISLDALIEVTLGNISIEDARESWTPPEELNRHIRGRPSLLTKYHCKDESLDGDCFAMYNTGGRMVGWHERVAGAKGINEGHRGFNWFLADQLSLTSTPDKPLVLVEGPYDVTETNRVACFGMITLGVLRKLAFHYLWVWPDPDCLDTGEKRESFVDMLTAADDYAFIQGFITSNGDPDEATIRAYVPFEERYEWLNVGSKPWIVSGAS